MRIAFFLSSQGGSPLQVGLDRGLTSLGHQVFPYSRHEGCDLILVFNQCSHCGYEYPEMPEGNTPIAFIDTAEFGYFKRLPHVIPMFKNTFSEAAMNHDTKDFSQQMRLKQFLEGRSFPYFLREKFTSVEYPASYHPIDYPLYEGSLCAARPIFNDYAHRSEDLFLTWGISHPWRNNLTAIMRGYPGKVTVLAVGENDTPRMPQRECFRRTMNAKCSVSFDGYGSSSFRLTEVLVRTVLLRGPLVIETRRNLTDGVNCVDYTVEHDGETFLSSNINERIAWVLADTELAFRIYEAGFNHCMEHFTETATAQYVLNTVAHHDYSKPTTLDL